MTAQELLDAEVRWIIESQCAAIAGFDPDALRNTKSPQGSASVALSRNSIPFLLVLPPPTILTKELLARVRVGGQSFVHDREPECFTNTQDALVAEKPYLIQGVEIRVDHKEDKKEKAEAGEERVFSLNDRRANLTKKKRRGLTLWEGINLVACFPSLLEKTFLDLVVSRFTPSEKVRAREQAERKTKRENAQAERFRGGIVLPDDNQQNVQELFPEVELVAGIKLMGNSPEIIAGPAFSDLKWSLVSCLL
jgi:hypothetical protein